MLEEILQRIDENLYLHPLIADQSKPAEQQHYQFNQLPLPPTPPNFFERVAEIRGAQAPYYAVSGNFLARLIKRTHNLVLKVFGRKQAYFNNLTLNLLESMAAFTSATQEHIKSQSVLTNALANQITLQQTDYQQLLARIEQLSAQRNDDQQRIEQLSARHSEEQQRIEQIARDQQGIIAWVDIIARKAEMASLNAREAITNQTQGTKGWPEPQIVDPEKYAQRLTEMKDQVRINVGCGEKPLPDYINVDMRPLPDVDILANAHRLPFDPGTVFEISSAHLIEHFREHHSRIILLPYWKSLLRSGGKLRVICPNWAAMLEELNAGRMPLDFFKKLTFGAQDYEGDDHFAMYTPETLEKLLLETGFRHVEKITLNRINGGCPEMELVART